MSFEEGSVTTPAQRFALKYPGILYVNPKVKIRHVHDGQSNKFVIGERDGVIMGTEPNGTVRTRAASTWCGTDAVTWLDTHLGPTSSDPRWTINSSVIGFKEQFVPFTSQHPGGADFCRADGSTFFVNDFIDGAVTGVVKLDGELLENASVSFHPESGRGSFGTTDANGRDELTFIKNRRGASIGSHKVTITITTKVWVETARRPELGQTARSVTEAASGQSRRELLPERYRLRESTVLSADVVAGSNTFDFDLESDDPE